MNYKMQVRGIRLYSAMKLGWGCILISNNLSDGLEENETTHDENSQL